MTGRLIWHLKMATIVLLASILVTMYWSLPWLMVAPLLIANVGLIGSLVLQLRQIDMD